MKILVDMNLSPSWIPLLEADGYETKHWSQVGSPSAPDTEIMQWARENRFVVLTHDLDYGALLFATQTTAPSVIQLRGLGCVLSRARHRRGHRSGQGAAGNGGKGPRKWPPVLHLPFPDLAACAEVLLLRRVLPDEGTGQPQRPDYPRGHQEA